MKNLRAFYSKIQKKLSKVKKIMTCPASIAIFPPQNSRNSRIKTFEYRQILNFIDYFMDTNETFLQKPLQHLSLYQFTKSLQLLQI